MPHYLQIRLLKKYRCTLASREGSMTSRCTQRNESNQYFETNSLSVSVSFHIVAKIIQVLLRSTHITNVSNNQCLKQTHFPFQFETNPLSVSVSFHTLVSPSENNQGFRNEKHTHHKLVVTTKEKTTQRNL